jgi:hypothetical protein
MAYSFQVLLLFFLLLGYAVFCAIIRLRVSLNKSKRNGWIWKQFIVCGLTFSIALVPLIITLSNYSNLLIVSWIFYDFLVSYVLVIEIPSWLRISKYDEQVLKLLKTIRTELVKMRFSFDEPLQNIKELMLENSTTLIDESIDDVLNDFVAVCDRIHNRDASLWELTLQEVSSAVESVGKRSKHPFPKLIDILALSGLSVLLAQILKLFG